MSRKLKVYGINYDGRTRRIVAATSRAAAARLIGAKPHHMTQNGSETWNTDEVRIAMREPGKVWAHSYSRGGKWESLENVKTEQPPVETPPTTIL